MLLVIPIIINQLFKEKKLIYFTVCWLVILLITPLLISNEYYITRNIFLIAPLYLAVSAMVIELLVIHFYFSLPDPHQKNFLLKDRLWVNQN